MNKLASLILYLLCYIQISGQVNLNIELIAHVQLDEEASDIWGYTDPEGIEYAVIGVDSGIRIYSLEDPSAPDLIKHIFSDRSKWRDFKTHETKIYGVADEGNDGLLVVDMKSPKDSIPHRFYQLNINLPNISGVLGKCHNLYIDQGIIYLSGCNIGNRGVIIAEIQDSIEQPIRPISATNNQYTHDVFVNDGIMYASDVFAGVLSIYDIQNLAAPQLLSSFETSNKFTHNAWSDPRNMTVYTTDEVPSAYVEAYGIDDLNDVKELDRIQSNRIGSPNVIVHNVHVYNEYLVVSHYTEGVTIIDASDPSNLVEVGYYDTFTDENQIGGGLWFFGCWGAYPFFDSGILIASDINNGLFVLKPDLKKAVRIEGRIIDARDGSSISKVHIRRQDRPDLSETSSLSGQFKMGAVDPGDYTLDIDHLLYSSKSVMVEFQENNNSEIEITLESSPTTIQVMDESNISLEGVKITVSRANDSRKELFSTSTKGEAIIPLSLDKDYILTITKWGYKEVIVNKSIGSDDGTIEVVLEEGYEDSFTSDNSWESSSFASSGPWELGTPILKSRQGILLQPPTDSPRDSGNSCYFTGLQGGGSNSGDVDNGFVRLESPFITLDSDEEFEISFDYWFINERGNTAKDDSLTIYLVGSDRRHHITTITESVSGWKHFSKSIRLENNSADEYYVEISAYDNAGRDHVVEAGFDNFSLFKKNSTSIEENEKNSVIQVYPNPTSGQLYFDNINSLDISQIQIIGMNGRVFAQVGNDHLDSNASIDISSLPDGVYIIAIHSSEGFIRYSRVVKTD